MATVKKVLYYLKMVRRKQVAEEVTENEDIEVNESNDEEKSCDICDFVGKTTADLNMHKKTKHLFGRGQRFSRF